MDGVRDTSFDVDKSDRRRTQVLKAAAACFSREGFHGASMASIAAAAALSVGQIYRDFENKEAIIAALVEQKLEEWAERMASVQAPSEQPADFLLEAAQAQCDKLRAPHQTALWLEILAEAARNPRVAEIVRQADLAVAAIFRELLLRSGVRDDDQLETRVNRFALLLDGWAVRAVKDRHLSQEDCVRTLRPLLAAMLAP